ncbi:hypothetical protein PENARI_c039G03306 [Penicillium arizonense]|uniref:Uncharacterized protein n=1 Tax=Penicillium arizonense TaxID=1835702 RepID=A0A1F5L366_PENAI|nr:hypothetical protein PENARI_c039G03306 [Penicillium arizonense]OGE47635.1 hypothetical protein PENARI_c039G03306 [Penicillium arizonense]
MNFTTTATSHTAFRESLEGQTITIPNIYQLIPGWNPRLHKEYERARDDILNPWIERWVDDKGTARKLKAADFVFDCGALKYDTYVVGAYREASLQYFKFTLIDEGEAPDLSSFDMELQKSLQCWDEVGLHIHQICSKEGLETREILCDEMLRYVGSLNNVDSIFDDCCIPSLEQYWDRREATAAAYCVVATIPYGYLTLPLFNTERLMIEALSMD